jgi:hypothetical protein
LLEDKDYEKDMHRMLYDFIEKQFQEGELIKKLQKGPKNLKSNYSYLNKIISRKEELPVDNRNLMLHLVKNDCLYQREKNNWGKPQ